MLRASSRVTAVKPGLAALRSFLGSERGAAAPLVGLLAVVLIGLMGFGIDTGRSVLVRARLADALDAAGLAVGARLSSSTAEFTTEATKFVAANFASGYSGATVTQVTATPNANKSVITLNATATMPTSFMRLFGSPTVTVKASSEITRKVTGLELVMALDNTLSMASDMSTLQKAARTLVETVMPTTNTGNDKVYVGLVPFSQAVNIKGAAASNWTTASNSTWSSITCVEARYKDGLDQSDAPPTTTATKFIKLDSNPGYACPQKMLPMTPTAKTVNDAINTMTATGFTHISEGAAWAWRMISPKWRGYWSGDMPSYSLPLDYNTPRMMKAVVLMTDGENTFTESNYTAYRYLKDNRLNTNNKTSEQAVAELNKRLANVCTQMRAAGIVVYTVAFDVNNAAIKKILSDCATSGTVLEANSSSLSTTFQMIGSALSNLRVSK